MSSTDIKDVVKEKYGQAALRVKSWRQQSAAEPPRQAARVATRSLPICTTPPRRDKSPRRPCSPRWGAEIQPHWRN